MTDFLDKLIIEKKDGRLSKYNKEKLLKGVVNAVVDSSSQFAYNEEIFYKKFLEILHNRLEANDAKENITVTTATINQVIIEALKEVGLFAVAVRFEDYMKERKKVRMRKTSLMKFIHANTSNTDRDNANVGNNFSSKLLRSASEVNKLHNLTEHPKQISKLHENGDLYYHDLDAEAITINCLHIDPKQIYDKSQGFNTGYGKLNKPSRIESAASLLCIILQSSQNDMFGGQSIYNFEESLEEPYRLTIDEVTKDYLSAFKVGLKATNSRDIILDDKNLLKKYPDIQKEIDTRCKWHLHQAMQSIVCNLNTMHSRSGSQVPFSSINLGVPSNQYQADICEAFLLEYDKGIGVNHAQPIFPNIIFRCIKGYNRGEGAPYLYLFKLACRVSAKRMNPTFMNIDCSFNKEYYETYGNLPATMGCRTYIYTNVNGESTPARRGNIFPVTIILPRIGIRANKDIDKFFELLDQRIEDCKMYILYRYNLLCKLKGKDLPFTIGEHLIMGSEDVTPDSSIEPVLKQGTYGIGFIGLAETLVALTGHHHGETEEARELGYQIIQHMRDKCNELTKELHLNVSLYATPAEGLSGKSVAKDKEIFGSIKGITDKDYYTNSFHIPVKQSISIVDKLTIEAPFHAMCNGGHISYIEMDGSPTPETIERIINYAYDNTNINYMGINFHLRYCADCGETNIPEGSTFCPVCNSSNIKGISRVTGYLSFDERFGAGKTAERNDRHYHINTINQAN